MDEDSYQYLHDKLMSQYNKACSSYDSLSSSSNAEGAIASDLLNQTHEQLDAMHNTINLIVNKTDDWDNKTKRKAKKYLKEMHTNYKTLLRNLAKYDEADDVAIILDDNLMDVDDDQDPEKPKEQIISSDHAPNQGSDQKDKKPEEDFKLCTLIEFIQYLCELIVFLSVVFTLYSLWS